MRFSNEEFVDLAKAWGAISLAFAIILSGEIGIVIAFVVAAITVGLGFLLHELAHKFVAQYYNCWAEFRADDRMLVFAVASAFLGFIFAAPGAVMIRGRISRRQNGLISAAGPVTNIVLAWLFFLVPLPFAEYGAMINAFLALFNMIPFMGLDGQKVLAWNTRYFIALVAAGFLTFWFV